MVTDEVVYMTADEEDDYIVAQANEPLDENGTLRQYERVTAPPPRRDPVEVERDAGRLHGRLPAA